MRYPSFHTRPHGFTLIEQVAALAVMAILTAMAIPAMGSLVTRSAVQVTEDALYTAAQLARTSAVTHNTHVLLCPSLDGRHCAGKPQWQQGWIVALDHNRDGQPDGSILASGKPDSHVRIVGSSGRDHVRFRADGAAVGTNISLVVCPRQGHDQSAHVVVVSNAGRIREATASTAQQARCKVTG